MEERRCPTCGKLLGKTEGAAALWCPRCKKEIIFKSVKNAEKSKD